MLAPSLALRLTTGVVTVTTRRVLGVGMQTSPRIHVAFTINRRRLLSSVSPIIRDDDDHTHNDHDDDNEDEVLKQVVIHSVHQNQGRQQRQHQQQQEQLQQGASLVIATTHNDGSSSKHQVRTDADASDRAEDSIETSVFVSPSELVYTGNTTIPVTSQLHIVRPGEDAPRGTWPVFRMMDENGTFRDGSNDGYRFKKVDSTSDSSAEFVPPTSHFSVNPDEHAPLAALRTSLQKAYPNHTVEINRNGFFLPSKHNYPDTGTKDTLERAHRQMVRLQQMDTILQNAQRQGRISFYMTCRGEEAIHFGAASALELQDTILAQYREQGLLMWRGFTLQQFSDQCFSNEADLGKGRQMPVHYGSKALNYQTISSPLGTQIPQASGAAYRLKLQGKNAVSICFFGEGSTSTTDFHSGLNFAATLGCPVIFFCRNNGYAISTSVKDQYRGDGVVSRAPGYGMAAIRVDGNDMFAVHAAVREARAYALEHTAPVLIEAMSYRQGHHSTSDDSLRYRSFEEVEHFAENSCPLKRLQAFLKRHYDMTEHDFRAAVDEEKIAVLDAMHRAESKPKPSLEELFEDVYEEMPLRLQSQEKELHAHIAKYPSQYRGPSGQPLSFFASGSVPH